jgi:hypothetical protein
MITDGPGVLRIFPSVHTDTRDLRKLWMTGNWSTWIEALHGWALISAFEWECLTRITSNGGHIHLMERAVMPKD